MELTGSQIREELFRRIDEVVVHNDLIEGFRLALIDESLVRAYNRNVRFFGMVESALFNSIVVLLYSLYETRRDTVSFRTLLDAVAAQAGEESVDLYRTRITTLKPLIAKVAILRNEAVGHLSTGRPLSETHTRANLMYSDVSDLLVETRRLFHEISNEHFGVSSGFREQSQFATMAVLTAARNDSAP